MQNLNNTVDFKTFFESNNITKVNQNIIEDYFAYMIAENKKDKTIEYNVNIMKFVLKVIKNDLNKLTKKDTLTFQAAIRNKDCAESTKKQYVIGFKRFLHWYAKNDEFENRRDYIELADNMKMKFEVKHKDVSDLLTGEEIMEMVNAAQNVRDAAIIAVLYDSGCRVGELVSCKIKHVEFVSDECNITFPKSKTITRTSLLIFAKGYLEAYLKRHPLRHDKEAPLFVTEKLWNTGPKDKPIKKYKVLETTTILAILKKTAKLAGINKRVHPHLFRHTRATELATSLTEAELRNQFGWAAESNVPSLYVHLSGKDAANALRKHYGLINVKKNCVGIEMGACENCQTLNPATESFCIKCHLPLSKEARIVSDITKQALDSFFKENIEIRDKFVKYYFNDNK